MSTDTMSTTDNKVLTDILNTLQGLSPPAILTTMSDSLDTLNGSFTILSEAFTKFNEAFTKFNEAFTKFAEKVLEKLEPNWLLEGLNLAIGSAGLGLGIKSAMAAGGTAIAGGATLVGGISLGTIGLILAGILAILGLIYAVSGGGGTGGGSVNLDGLGNPATASFIKESADWDSLVPNPTQIQKFIKQLEESTKTTNKITTTSANPNIPPNIEKIVQQLLISTNTTNSIDNLAYLPMTAKTSQIVLPATNQVAPKYIPVTPNLTKIATVVNTPNKEDLVGNNKTVNANFTTSMFSNNSSNGAKGSSSSTSNAVTNHHQNVYNIANIDIADGVIYEIEDFLASVRRRANTIRNASNIA